MATTFRVLEERPVTYLPLPIQRVYLIKVNRLSSIIAKADQTALQLAAQKLVAITPNIPHKEADELLHGKSFIGLDGVAYQIQGAM